MINDQPAKLGHLIEGRPRSARTTLASASRDVTSFSNFGKSFSRTSSLIVSSATANVWTSPCAVVGQDCPRRFRAETTASRAAVTTACEVSPSPGLMPSSAVSHGAMSVRNCCP